MPKSTACFPKARPMSAANAARIDKLVDRYLQQLEAEALRLAREAAKKPQAPSPIGAVAVFVSRDFLGNRKADVAPQWAVLTAFAEIVESLYPDVAYNCTDGCMAYILTKFAHPVIYTEADWDKHASKSGASSAAFVRAAKLVMLSSHIVTMGNDKLIAFVRDTAKAFSKGINSF